MEKQEIKIDAGIIKRIILAFILAFTTVFIVEHFCSFSYEADTSNMNIYKVQEGITMQEYNPSTTRVLVLSQRTPFGTNFYIRPNGMKVSELKGEKFNSYFNKIQLYFNAVFKDFKYLLMIWGGFILILLFFRKYKLKVAK